MIWILQHFISNKLALFQLAIFWQSELLLWVLFIIPCPGEIDVSLRWPKLAWNCSERLPLFSNNQSNWWVWQRKLESLTEELQSLQIRSIFTDSGYTVTGKKKRKTERQQWKDLVACLFSLRNRLLQQGSEGSEAPWLSFINHHRRRERPSFPLWVSTCSSYVPEH